MNSKVDKKRRLQHPHQSANYQHFYQYLLVVILLLPAFTQAQSPTLAFQYLTIRQELPSNYATSILQDDLGFMWVGTVNGLARFDGQRCISYNRQAGNSNSLSHRIVRCLFKAQDGSLWVGTQRGLNRYNPDKQNFQRYSFTSLGAGCNFIRTIAQTPDGRFWMGTNNGVVIFNPVSAKAELLSIPTDSSSLSAANNIRRLLLHGTTLWIGTQAGLYAYDQPTGKLQAYRHTDGLANSLPDDYITALATIPQTNELLIGTRNGKLATLTTTSRVFRPMPFESTGQTISGLLFTKNRDLWIGIEGGGLRRYDPSKKRYQVYLNDENNPRSLNSNSVKGMFQDQGGMLWVVTDDFGVSWCNPTGGKLHSIFDDVGYRPASSLGLDAAGLSVDSTNCLWVGTRDGLAYINPLTQQFRLYRHDPQNPFSLENNLTFSVLADQKGYVWVGTASGLNRLNTKTGRFERILSLPSLANPSQQPEFRASRQDFVAGNQIFTVVGAPDGRIFIGTNEKLTIYDPKTQTFRHQFNDERIRKLPGKNYNTLYFDRHHNLWVGGLGPVYKISPDLQLLAEYTSHEEDPKSLPDEGVTDFEEDRFGRMWFCTDNGLALLHPKSGHFSVFTTRNGLPNNDTAAMLLIGDTLWVSTSKGLASVDIRSLKINAFKEADGSPPSEFESGSMIRDANGRLYTGAMRGLVYIDPHHIPVNRYAPPVFLTSFKVNEQEFLQGSQRNPPRIVLDYTQNMFSFEMAALSFDNPGNNSFAYRLENFDDHWNQINNRPFASYTNVPPGNYILHVIAANTDGIWNRKGYRLALTIKAPFWQTWWFRFLALSTLIGLTVVIARRREQKLTREQQEKSELRERIAASEMKALRSQMNPHFLYNSLNAIRLFVLQNDSDNADKYLVKFARLMRLILDNSRLEWVTLASELEQLALYLELEQLRFGHRFDFSIDADPALSRETTSIPPMIIQPYIENAILHGMAHKKSKGQILVTVRSVGQQLECVVDDNGVGRHKAMMLKSQSTVAHKSVGLKVTEDRIQLISQRSGQEAGVRIIDKKDKDNESTGTRVIIQLPLITQ